MKETSQCYVDSATSLRFLVAAFDVYLLQVLSSDGTQEVGKITKQWSGLAKEYFTDADNFGMQCKLTCHK